MVHIPRMRQFSCGNIISRSLHYHDSNSSWGRPMFRDPCQTMLLISFKSIQLTWNSQPIQGQYHWSCYICVYLHVALEMWDSIWRLIWLNNGMMEWDPGIHLECCLSVFAHLSQLELKSELCPHRSDIEHGISYCFI